MTNQSSFDPGITKGPVFNAVWKLAWPTALMNAVSGLQGIVDHAMVGHFVGYQGNAAVGVSWQIFLVVIVFISSVFSGMAVLASRFAGANEPDAVNRVVYNAFLVATVLACFVFAPIGYVLAPNLLAMVKATPEVTAEALPYLRIMLVFSFGKLLFFMFAGALRAVGDAKTPLRLGLVMTTLNLVLNIVLIRGLGPIPAFGTTGAALGTVIASGIVAFWGLYLCYSGKTTIQLRGVSLRPDFGIIRQFAHFGLPTGFQGVAVNIAGVIMLRFVGSLEHSAEAHAAFTICYNQLFALVSWTSVGLMHATATVSGQNLGADLPERTKQAPMAAFRIGLVLSGIMGLLFLSIPEALLGVFGIAEPKVTQIGVELLQYLAFSSLCITGALAYTGGLNGTGATRSTMVISLISQILVPIGICLFMEARGTLMAQHIWAAILAGHFARWLLAYGRFKQGKWADIEVKLPTKA